MANDPRNQNTFMSRHMRLLRRARNCLLPCYPTWSLIILIYCLTTSLLSACVFCQANRLRLAAYEFGVMKTWNPLVENGIAIPQLSCSTYFSTYRMSNLPLHVPSYSCGILSVQRNISESICVARCLEMIWNWIPSYAAVCTECLIGVECFPFVCHYYCGQKSL